MSSILRHGGDDGHNTEKIRLPMSELLGILRGDFTVGHRVARISTHSLPTQARSNNKQEVFFMHAQEGIPKKMTGLPARKIDHGGMTITVENSGRRHLTLGAGQTARTAVAAKVKERNMRTRKSVAK